MAAGRTRRRREDQNLDSLLDTMANVTGILVVLLAVTQISVGDAMGRLREVLEARPELTPESLARVEAEAETLRADLQPFAGREEALAARHAAAEAEIAKLRAETASLAREVAQGRDARSGTLRARTRDVLGREQALRGEIAAEREALAALEGGAPSDAALARDIRLPDPRPAPAGAREVNVLVRHGRALVVDERELLGALYRGVERALGAPYDRVALSVLPLHQRIRLASHFDRVPIGSQGFRWRIADEGGELKGVLGWRRDSLGETAEELRAPASSFQRELRRMSPQRAYLRYMVWADSFETYLTARSASDAEAFSAGFVPFEVTTEITQPLTRDPRSPRFVD